MSIYRKRPETVTAFPWWKNGDHPGDGTERDKDGNLREGKVVRYFRAPGVIGEELCPTCRRTWHDHGWIDSGGEGQAVCPGDFIIGTPETGYTAMHPEAFQAAYALEHEG